MKAASSALLAGLGRAALTIAGPYKHFDLKLDSKGEYRLMPPQRGIFEWRVNLALQGWITIEADDSERARAPLSGDGAHGMLTIASDAPLTVRLRGASAPPRLRVELRPLDRYALAAHIMALRANRRAIVSRWIRHGREAGAEALLAARRGGPIDDYAAWIAAFETPQLDAPQIKTWLKTLTDPTLISVVTPVYETPSAFLTACLDSVRAQLYPHWEHCLIDDCSPGTEPFAQLERAAASEPRIRVQRSAQNRGIAAATNDALAMTRGRWIAFLDHDDTLSPDALALAAAAIAANPDARIIYTDEDKIDEAGARSDPFMKGGWNPALFAAQNYLNHLTLIRRDLIDEVGELNSAFDGSQDYDLLLRCTTRVEPHQIVHIPAVTYHWRFASGGGNFSVRQAEKAQSRMRAAFTANVKDGAQLKQAADGLPYPRLRPAPPSPAPLISLIIPTRDRADLLERCIVTLKAKAGWPHVEVIVMDNDSRASDALALLQGLQDTGAARVAPFPGPFNFSAINNAGAKLARGQILGFVNNDIEALSYDWLTEMARWFSEPRIGAVGAKLLYPDGRVQHAGLVTGIGGSAGHLYKYREGSDPGPFGILARARDVSALTAACMLVRAEAFHAVGGFDEAAFPVAFNDVDLCLRLRAAGHRLIWTPDAVLTHHESASRGADDESDEKRARLARECAALRARWRDKLDADPFYSPNLTLADESGGLAWPPRYRRPWLPDWIARADRVSLWQ